MSKKEKKSLFERMLDAHAPVEDVVMETGEHEVLPEPATDNTKQHKAGCQYQRHPFVCNCA